MPSGIPGDHKDAAGDDNTERLDQGMEQQITVLTDDQQHEQDDPTT